MLWYREVLCLDDDVIINVSHSYACVCVDCEQRTVSVCLPYANIVEPSATSLFIDVYGVTCIWWGSHTLYHLNGGERAERHLLGELGCGWAARLDHRF